MKINTDASNNVERDSLERTYFADVIKYKVNFYRDLMREGDGSSQVDFEHFCLPRATLASLLATGPESHLVPEDDDVVNDAIDAHEIQSICGHYAPTGGCQSFYKR